MSYLLQSSDGSKMKDDCSGSCQRTSLLHDITLNNDGSISSAFYREGNYKLLIGDVGTNTGWYDTDQTDAEIGDAYDSSLEYLFDVSGDDYEVTNLRYDDAYADLVTSMKATIDTFVPEVYDFGISGRCSIDDCIDTSCGNAAGCWTSGCCNL